MSGLIDLSPTADPNRFTLGVTPQVCVGHPDHQFLFGGAAMGAAIAAVEAATGRPTVWATAQYLSFARPPARLDLDVPVAGRYSSQARVTGHVGETEILTVNAAPGSRPDAVTAQWSAMPAVPPPGDCPQISFDWVRRDDDINGQFDQRSARGRFGAARSVGGPSADGVSTMWVRARGGGEHRVVDRVTLALMADFLPSGIGHALGSASGGNSLDNTIRFLGIVPTEWVLCETKIEGMGGGFAHGRMRLFAETGELLATASQSMIVRHHVPAEA